MIIARHIPTFTQRKVLLSETGYKGKRVLSVDGNMLRFLRLCCLLSSVYELKGTLFIKFPVY